MKTVDPFHKKGGVKPVVAGLEACTPDKLEDLLPKIKELGFNSVRSHDRTIESSGTPTTNGVHIYCGNNAGVSRFKNNYTRVNILSNDSELNVCYIDGAFEYSESFSDVKAIEALESDTHLNIIYDKVVVGYYDAIKNNLHLSDVTHTSVDSEVGAALSLLKELLDVVEVFNTKFSIEREFTPYALSSIEKIGKVMIGLDPEFAILDKDKNRISASSVLSGGTTAEVGIDGHSSTGELRPKPGTPVELTKTMKVLYKRLKDDVDNYHDKGITVFAGGGEVAGTALGGHIHFNFKQNKLFINMLDDFIGAPLTSIKGGKRSSGNSYGKLGACNNKSYGFEYRTPPSFIGKPDLFEGVIAVAYCLARSWQIIVNYQKAFTYNDKPTPDDYRNLPYYKTYKRQIELFIEYITEDKSIEEYDTLAAWEISESRLTDITV